MDHSYYKINKLLLRWSKKDGARIVHEATLSMDKAPPALPYSRASVVKSTRAPRQPKPDPAVKMLDDIGKAVDAFSRFKTWLNTPDPPKPPKAPQLTKPAKTVPPFDIQEIPGAMRKEMMPIGAKLMDRWFAGRLNYSPTPADEKAEISQEGKPYPPEMYDTTTIKLDWVLKSARAKEKFDYLISEAVRSPAARKVLHDKLVLYKDRDDIFTTDICGEDPKELHKLFQFQRVDVDGTFSEKIATQLTADVERFGVPDDLSAALGSFNLYAAIGSVRFFHDTFSYSSRTKTEVTGVWVYVKDNYTFTDQQGERSQYLGHWSSNGIIVIPLDQIASFSSGIPYVDSPITVGNPAIKGETYYPIHNSDFRAWSTRHRRGGDFIIFSDRRFVPIFPPIPLYL